MRRLPLDVAKRLRVVPLSVEGDRLMLAMADTRNVLVREEVEFVTGYRVIPVPAAPEILDEWLDRWEKTGDPNAEAVAGLEPEGEDPPRSAVAAVESILQHSIEYGASDVHIEPGEDGGRIRYRVDGLLQSGPSLTPDLYNSVLARIKVLAQLDLTKRRVPQDGRFQFSLDEGRAVDIRVSVVPTIHGEKMVLRILDTQAKPVSLEEMHWHPKLLSAFEKMICQPHGLVLVTGPTGSGKTTTLYAVLQRIQDISRNIVTIEDPVEYILPGINQIQVNPPVGLTFARGLRAVLRQDPDVILVGEIRDAETAQIAVHAALTGHLVLSTLHTNSACVAPARLMDMGVEPFLLADALVGVVAQRLVRRCCPACRGKGGENCDVCRGTGFRGRLPLHEVMPVTREVRRALVQRAPEEELENLVRRAGWPSLKDDGEWKIRSGLTVREEVWKATQLDEVISGDGETAGLSFPHGGPVTEG